MILLLDFLYFVALIYAVIFMTKVKRVVTTDAPLTKNEKIIVIVSTFFNPVIAGAIYYYGWKGQLPTKAKQANKYSWAMFLTALVVYGVVFVFFPSTLKQ